MIRAALLAVDDDELWSLLAPRRPRHAAGPFMSRDQGHRSARTTMKTAFEDGLNFDTYQANMKIARGILEKAEFRRVLAATPPGALLVVDEAYGEYVEEHPGFPDALRELQAQPRPWIILRTFSKAYGLAGLRVGYALASDTRIVRWLDRVPKFQRCCPTTTRRACRSSPLNQE